MPPKKGLPVPLHKRQKKTPEIEPVMTATTSKAKARPPAAPGKAKAKPPPPAKAESPGPVVRATSRILNSESEEDLVYPNGSTMNVGPRGTASSNTRRVKTENYNSQKTMKNFVDTWLCG